MTSGDRSHADSRLIAELTAGKTVEAAASAAGISPATAHRRLREPEFRRALQSARDQLIDRILGRLAAVATDAIDALQDVMSTGSDSARVQAARSILEHLGRYREQNDLTERIRELESQAENEKSRKSFGATRK